MRRIVVGAAAAVMVGAGVFTPASAVDEVGPLPADPTPIVDYDAFDYAGLVFSVGRQLPRRDGVQLVGGCHYALQNFPTSNRALMVSRAEASAAGGGVTAYGRPVSVGVTCTVASFYGNGPTFTFSAAESGTTVEAADVREAIGTRYRVCTSLSAMYSSGTYVRTATSCRTISNA